MPPFLTIAGGALAILAAAVAPAAAWQVHVGSGFGEDVAQAVAFLPDGDVVAGGITQRSGDQGVATVVRLTRDGRLAWRTLIEPRGSQVRAVVVDGRGDLVVGALVGGFDESYLGRFTVVKLDARSGAERWRFDAMGVRGTVAVDRDDDVVVGTVREVDDEDGLEPECSLLDGRDGSVRWRRVDCGEHVAIAPGGDIVTAYARTVRRLSPAGGTDLWRTSVPVGVALLRVAGDGAIVVADATEVVRLDAGGAFGWRHDLAIPPPVGGIREVVPDVGGDVLVTGTSTFVPGRGTDAVVARLSGSDGHERWRRTLDGDGAADLYGDRAGAMGVGRRREVLVAAVLEVDEAPRVTVLGLDVATGAVRWRRQPRGPAGATALAVDRHGAIAVTGSGGAPGSDQSYMYASFVVLRLVGRAVGPVRVY